MPSNDHKAPKDNRFASIRTDPRFKLPKKKSIRGELDSRFKDALDTDERFKKTAHIDKYGRNVEEKGLKKELSRYYNFEEDEASRKDTSGSENDSDSQSEDDNGSVSDSSDSEDEDKDSSDTSIESVPISDKKGSQKDKKKPSMRELMRGEGVDSESESSDEDSSDEEDEHQDLAEQADEYERVRSSGEAVPQGDESKRLAVVNLDWDNITSTDLMATFSSFLPPSRSIISVKIFPSEYGKSQMATEEMNGPAQELFDHEGDSQKDSKKKNKNDETGNGDEDYSSSRLRRYQLQRLQYYYAVVECDSIETASTIYTSCDGTEYESTANFFDLRFIPDEVDFSGDKPRDECFKVPASYKPSNFTTDALQHSKVKLTWDETPKERARVAQKAFSSKDVEDDDIKAYLASESDEDEDEATIAQRYRKLLMGEDNGGDSFGQDKSSLANDGGSDHEAVEITFNPVLEGKEAKLEIVDDQNSHSSNDGVNPEDNLSTIEKYKLKEKQRKLRRMENYRARKAAENEESERSSENNKAELELLAMDDELLENTPKEADVTEKSNRAEQKTRKLTKRAAKKKAEEEAENDFDTADPRFQALYEDPDFAIDSTLPQYKKTKGMEKIIGERRKRQDKGVPTKSKPKRKFQPAGESTDALVSKLRRKHAS